ncbi:PucR family transcriptional regulator (plasmid) [Pseudonocardia sp. EC080610-09]|nr:PucR family transcriptional regulator [Pseudonocardia sp. EC080610-09]ALL85765.1 PucR family transcriptional regulator [Pseudonocardia sp. EC080619-01]
MDTRPGTTASQAWLRRVAQDAGHGAGGVPAELLGDFLIVLVDAATSGRLPDRSELDAVGHNGRRAAELGVSAGNAVQLYLSAGWRLWRELPDTVGFPDTVATARAAEAVLRTVDLAVAALADGYTAARRDMVRNEETLRREVIEDLLRGDGDAAGLVQRAEPFGLDLGRPHQVALAAPHGAARTDTVPAALERSVVDGVGDRDVLVATKDGRIVVVAPATSVHDPDLGVLLHRDLNRSSSATPWRVAVGRPHPGSYGIARSYEEARDALGTAARLRLRTSLLRAEDMLVYRVLLRDQPAITDLVQTVVAPLAQARGGAQPLLNTAETYFATGCVTAETARRLNLSVRAVSYRLERIAELTGHDPTDPSHRFTLHAAVLGARLLDWPEHDLRTGDAD